MNKQEKIKLVKETIAELTKLKKTRGLDAVIDYQDIVINILELEANSNGNDIRYFGIIVDTWHSTDEMIFKLENWLRTAYRTAHLSLPEKASRKKLEPVNMFRDIPASRTMRLPEKEAK